MSGADHFVLGDWNVRCDRCGKKIKGSTARQTWQGYQVCPEHWEPRHPQDFVRSIKEHPTPEFVRNPPPIFLPTPEGILIEDQPDSPFGGDFIFLLTEDSRILLTED